MDRVRLEVYGFGYWIVSGVFFYGGAFVRGGALHRAAWAAGPLRRQRSAAWLLVFRFGSWLNKVGQRSGSWAGGRLMEVQVRREWVCRWANCWPARAWSDRAAGRLGRD